MNRIENEPLQERYTKVLRLTGQQPDIEEPYQDRLTPKIVGITYSWTAEELRGTAGDADGEQEVRVEGDRTRSDGSTHTGTVHYRWQRRESWPQWIRDLADQELPKW